MKPGVALKLVPVAVLRMPTLGDSWLGGSFHAPPDRRHHRCFRHDLRRAGAGNAAQISAVSRHISLSRRRRCEPRSRKGRHSPPTRSARLPTGCYSHKDIGASIASGSFRCDGMLVAPCSIKTLSGIAHCYADDLISARRGRLPQGTAARGADGARDAAPCRPHRADGPSDPQRRRHHAARCPASTHCRRRSTT